MFNSSLFLLHKYLIQHLRRGWRASSHRPREGEGKREGEREGEDTGEEDWDVRGRGRRCGHPRHSGCCHWRPHLWVFDSFPSFSPSFPFLLYSFAFPLFLLTWYVQGVSIAQGTEGTTTIQKHQEIVGIHNALIICIFTPLSCNILLQRQSSLKLIQGIIFFGRGSMFITFIRKNIK